MPFGAWYCSYRMSVRMSIRMSMHMCNVDTQVHTRAEQPRHPDTRHPGPQKLGFGIRQILPVACLLLTWTTGWAPSYTNEDLTKIYW